MPSTNVHAGADAKSNPGNANANPDCYNRGDADRDTHTDRQPLSTPAPHCYPNSESV